MTYYHRICRWVNLLDALKPVTKESWHPDKITSKKFQEELEWYHDQKWEKTTKQRFYQRLYQGRSKEDAIKKELPKREKKPMTVKPWYIRQPKVEKKEPVDDWIIIRYSKEESIIIRKEYAKMIEDLEYQWRATDDPNEAKVILDKLDKLKVEYDIFCKTNY